MIRFENIKRSIGYAIRGLETVWHEEQNFRIEILAGLCAIFIGVVLGFNAVELSIITLLVGIILALECLNSALERMVDIVKPRVSEYVRVVKDTLAAMMILLVLISCVIAALLYIPKLLILGAIVSRAIFY